MWWITSIANASSSFMPPQASTVAEGVDNLYLFLIIISVISSALVIGGMIYFVMKYKRKSAEDQTAYITHNNLAEFLWSFIPLVLFLVSFVWGWIVYHDLRTAPEGAEEIYVKAKKWEWEFEYNNGFKSPGELIVPVGKPVKLLMTSEDVLHSFFVPSFRVKQDVVPGKYSQLWFEAQKEGTYQVFCTEYCGLNHSGMLATVKVISAEDYDLWLQGKKKEQLTPVQLGMKIYKTRNCNGCHSVDGTDNQGPSFKALLGATRTFTDGSSATADENYLRESILNPQAKIVKGRAPVMPAFAGILTEDEVKGVIEYIKTLK